MAASGKFEHVDTDEAVIPELEKLRALEERAKDINSELADCIESHRSKKTVTELLENPSCELEQDHGSRIRALRNGLETVHRAIDFQKKTLSAARDRAAVRIVEKAVPLRRKQVKTIDKLLTGILKVVQEGQLLDAELMSVGAGNRLLQASYVGQSVAPHISNGTERQITNWRTRYKELLK